MFVPDNCNTFHYSAVMPVSFQAPHLKYYIDLNIVNFRLHYIWE